MKTRLTLYLLALGLVTASNLARAQGTAFTYQGRLNFNGAPVNGSYDFRFSIYSANAAGSLVAGPLAMDAISVVNGLFVTRLDFGVGVFTGPARWLEVSVRPAGNGNFLTLDQRLELTSSPYSIRAQAAGVADSIAAGSVVKSLNGLHDDITLAAGANVTLTPNGNMLTLSAAGAGGSGIWSVNGNNAYYTAGNVGIGINNPQEKLTIAGVASYNGGLKLTGSSAGGTGLSLENTSSGGHKWSLFSAGSGDSVGAGGFGIYDDTTSSYALAISAGGKIGIGTSTPTSPLTVKTGALLPYGIEQTDGTVRLSTYINSIGGWLGTISNHKLHFYVNNGVPSVTVDTAGNVGIGTTDPAVKLQVEGDLRATRLLLRADPAASANAAILCDNPNVANFVPFNNANGRPLNIIARDATVRMLTITGGADLAEPFAMSHDGISPGSVVIIDEENPGQLKVSTQAYDARVAGVVSGANGITPGISLHQEGAVEGDENVALSGRVYVQADATFGAIKPGDLLTTSDTPGHAMKVMDHAKAQGAVLGKAMTSLKEGKGMVLVLVTLQ